MSFLFLSQLYSFLHCQNRVFLSFLNRYVLRLQFGLSGQRTGLLLAHQFPHPNFFLSDGGHLNSDGSGDGELAVVLPIDEDRPVLLL